MYVDRDYRNCGCGNSQVMQNEMYQYGDSCGCMKQEQIDCDMMEQMAKEIQCCEFAITDIALFLDTHPNDMKATCLHRKYCNQLRSLQDSYLRMFGPLTINSPCNKWRWIEEPWPWEGSDC